MYRKYSNLFTNWIFSLKSKNFDSFEYFLSNFLANFFMLKHSTRFRFKNTLYFLFLFFFGYLSSHICAYVFMYIHTYICIYIIVWVSTFLVTTGAFFNIYYDYNWLHNQINKVSPQTSSAVCVCICTYELFHFTMHDRLSAGISQSG